MTYQFIYSSEATMPMQSDDLEELLRHARNRNRIEGISGALVYAEGMFLQILEGPVVKLQRLMQKISRDVRHETVTVLQEGEIPSARFSQWNMAYVSATPEQVARWAGIAAVTGRSEVSNDLGEDLRRTARFAHDILGLLEPETPGAAAQHPEPDGN